MLRVMLVDDEPMALEGLCLLIDWQAEGFSVCAKCSSAMEALAQIPILQPQLIVTDIRMPVMDGLELMRQAKAAGYDGQFIVVSGYGDFVYAQQALHLGVAGYLLKPIEPGEAGSVLEHVRHTLITQEAAASDQQGTFQRNLSALLNGQTNVVLPNGYRWQLAVWGAPLPLEQAHQVLDSFPEGAATTYIIEDKEFIVVRWPCNAAAPSWQAANLILAQAHRKLLQADAVEATQELLKQRVMLSTHLDTNCAALTDRVHAMARTISLRQADVYQMQCAELETFCATCGADAKNRARRQLLAECSRAFYNNPEALHAFLAAQNESLLELGLLGIQLLTPDSARVSDRACAYVQAHYQERLTLKNVAQALGYNATYLGRVFRGEQSISFHDWLTRCRMDAAAVLLSSSADTIRSVAIQVGYPQYKPFLSHFKGHFTQTPEQYRKQHTP